MLSIKIAQEIYEQIQAHHSKRPLNTSNKNLLLRILDDLTEPSGFKSIIPYDQKDPRNNIQLIGGGSAAIKHDSHETSYNLLKNTPDHQLNQQYQNNQLLGHSRDTLTLLNVTNDDGQTPHSKGLYGILFEMRKLNNKADLDSKRSVKPSSHLLKANPSQLSKLHNESHRNDNYLLNTNGVNVNYNNDFVDNDNYHTNNTYNNSDFYSHSSKIIFYDNPASLLGDSIDSAYDDNEYDHTNGNSTNDNFTFNDNNDSDESFNHVVKFYKQVIGDSLIGDSERLISDQREYGLIDPSTMLNSIMIATTNNQKQQQLQQQQQQQPFHDCSIRVLLFKAKKYNEFGNYCTGLLRMRVCSGSCVTSEHGEPKIPFIARNHTSCNFDGSIRRHARLEECSSKLIGEKSNLRDYYYVEPLACKCQQCNTQDAECLTTNGPNLHNNNTSENKNNNNKNSNNNHKKQRQQRRNVHRYNDFNDNNHLNDKSDNTLPDDTVTLENKTNRTKSQS